MVRKQESDLLMPVSRYFYRKGFLRQELECQFYDYSIDIVCFAPRLDLSVGIELKLFNWKRAFEQALIYQLCSDWVVIALPETTISRINFGLLEEHGIGLLQVKESSRCRMLLEPQQSNLVKMHYKQNVINMTKRGRICL